MKPDPAKARSERASKANTLHTYASTRQQVAKALREAHTPLEDVQLWDALTYARGVGPVKAREWCIAARVFPLMKLRELTPHQRLALAVALDR